MSLKNIKATVGASGANIPADVVTVQFLLNCIPYSQGGPQQELYVDGIVTKATIQAIERFQQFHLGQSNGQIAANDITLNIMKKFDPLPSTAWVVPSDFNPSPYEINKAHSAGNISSGGIFKRTLDTALSEGVFKRTLDTISNIDTHMKRTIDTIAIEGIFKRETGK